MKPDSPKNSQLIARYPFLKEIIHGHLPPLGEIDARVVSNLTIKVEKADGDLMWRKGDNVGLRGDNGFIIYTSGKYEGKVMRQSEYVFAIGKTDKVLKEVTWPRNDEEARRVPVKYAHSALWREHHSDGSLSEPFGDAELKCLVWVTVQAFHKDTENNDRSGARFGDFCERVMEVIIYTKPEGGFHKLHDDSWMTNHLCLNSKVHVHAICQKNTDILNIFGRLDELCQLFQDDVFFNGMKEAFDKKGSGRGASGIFGTTKVLCAEMCGYNRVMLENGTCWVSFQLRARATGLYVLGMGGTLPQIRSLVKTIVRIWMLEPESRSSFKADDEVRVL